MNISLNNYRNFEKYVFHLSKKFLLTYYFKFPEKVVNHLQHIGVLISFFAERVTVLYAASPIGMQKLAYAIQGLSFTKLCRII